MGLTIPGKNLDMTGFDPSFGHTPWNLEMEKNLRIIDAAMFGTVVQGFGLPFTPVTGDLWIDTTDASLCLWSGVTWERYAPTEGFEVYVLGAHARYRYNGTAWVLAAPAGSGAVVFTQSGASTAWGPMPHTFSRYADVKLKDSSGRDIYGDVRETTIGAVFAYFANPVSGTAILS